MAKNIHARVGSLLLSAAFVVRVALVLGRLELFWDRKRNNVMSMTMEMSLTITLSSAILCALLLLSVSELGQSKAERAKYWQAQCARNSKS